VKIHIHVGVKYLQISGPRHMKRNRTCLVFPMLVMLVLLVLSFIAREVLHRFCLVCGSDLVFTLLNS
jgi:hypothetical protein